MSKLPQTVCKGISCLLVIWSVMQVFGLSVVGVLPLAAAAAYWLLLPERENCPKGIRTTAGILAGLFGFFSSFSQYKNLPGSTFLLHLLAALVCTLGLGLFFYAILAKALLMLDGKEAEISIRKNGGLVFLTSFLIIFLVWLLFFLVFYPGIVGEDAVWQLEQGLGTSSLSNHHPIAHTLAISALYKLGLAFFGTANGAAATVSIGQMFLLSLCCAFSVSRFWRLGFAKGLSILSVLFYSLAPCNIVFSFSVHKDPWFAGAFLVFCTVLLELLLDEQKGARHILRLVLLTVSALGVGLLRTNGKFALIVLVPFLLVRFWKKDKAAAILPVIAAAAVIVISGPVYNSVLGAVPVDTVEYLSIPLQQIARVYSTEGGRASAEDDAFIRQIIPTEKIPAMYNEKISDNIKNLIRSEGNQDYLNENKGAFFGVWFRMLLLNPDIYIEAYAAQTGGFWYPDSSGQGYLTSTPSNSLGIKSKHLIKGSFADLLAKWVDGTRATPIIAYTYSNGLTAWIMLFLAGLAFMRKSPAAVLSIPAIVLWLTLLVSTPVYSDNRYMYPIFALLPLLIAVASLKKKTN